MGSGIFGREPRGTAQRHAFYLHGLSAAVCCVLGFLLGVFVLTYVDECPTKEVFSSVGAGTEDMHIHVYWVQKAKRGEMPGVYRSIERERERERACKGTLGEGYDRVTALRNTYTVDYTRIVLDGLSRDAKV